MKSKKKKNIDDPSPKTAPADDGCSSTLSKDAWKAIDELANALGVSPSEAVERALAVASPVLKPKDGPSNIAGADATCPWGWGHNLPDEVAKCVVERLDGDSRAAARRVNRSWMLWTSDHTTALKRVNTDEWYSKDVLAAAKRFLMKRWASFPQLRALAIRVGKVNDHVIPSMVRSLPLLESLDVEGEPMSLPPSEVRHPIRPGRPATRFGSDVIWASLAELRHLKSLRLGHLDLWHAGRQRAQACLETLTELTLQECVDLSGVVRDVISAAALPELRKLALHNCTLAYRESYDKQADVDEFLAGIPKLEALELCKTMLAERPPGGFRLGRFRCKPFETEGIDALAMRLASLGTLKRLTWDPATDYSCGGPESFEDFEEMGMHDYKERFVADLGGAMSAGLSSLESLDLGKVVPVSWQLLSGLYANTALKSLAIPAFTIQPFRMAENFEPSVSGLGQLSGLEELTLRFCDYSIMDDDDCPLWFSGRSLRDSLTSLEGLRKVVLEHVESAEEAILALDALSSVPELDTVEINGRANSHPMVVGQLAMMASLTSITARSNKGSYFVWNREKLQILQLLPKLKSLNVDLLHREAAAWAKEGLPNVTLTSKDDLTDDDDDDQEDEEDSDDDDDDESVDTSDFSSEEDPLDRLQNAMMDMHDALLSESSDYDSDEDGDESSEDDDEDGEEYH